jgi:phosphoribosyl 1,2-cyclic phosphodiesterase
MLSLKIWGSRGTIPCPGADTVIYGGNTACLEIRAGGRLVIVDMGTGIRGLGDQLIVRDLQEKGSIDADIFITHTHWDHIMGFPVFAPLFLPSCTLRIRSPVSSGGETLQDILGGQLSYQYWPVRLSELAARIEYDQIKEATLDMGDGLRVSSKYLNHPILCLAYRFDYEGKSIVTAFDTEPFRNVFPTDPLESGYDEAAALEGEAAANEENEKLLRFYQGADILIYDSQYIAEEFYPSKLGWGHSTYDQAAAAARSAKVKKLIFFHHDPKRTDEQLAKIEDQFRQESEDAGGPEFIIARDGMTMKA